MSAYTSVKTTMQDQNCLVSALKSVGFPTVEVYAKPVTLNNAWGSTHGTRTAHVVVPRSSVAKKFGKNNSTYFSDLGFSPADNGSFEASINDMDTRYYNETFMDNLMGEYSSAMSVRHAEMNGMQVQEDHHYDSGSSVRRRLVFSIE